jgi:hypothetical protein
MSKRNYLSWDELRDPIASETGPVKELFLFLYIYLCVNYQFVLRNKCTAQEQHDPTYNTTLQLEMLTIHKI